MRTYREARRVRVLVFGILDAEFVKVQAGPSSCVMRISKVCVGFVLQLVANSRDVILVTGRSNS